MQSLTVITAPPTRVLTKNLVTGDTYDKVSRLKSVETMPFATLRELHTLLKGLARRQHSCVIRGTLRDNAELPLLRRRTHFDDAPQSWVMLDIDDMRAPVHLRDWPYSDEHAEYARSQLPAAFQNAGCVWQASASAGQDLKVLKLHLWFLLDAPLTSHQLRTWLKGTDNVDPSTLRVVQPHYTADPIGGSAGKRLGRLKGSRVTTPEDINDVETEPVSVTSLEPRPKGCVDVADAQIEGAVKAAVTRSRALLEDPNIVGWQAAYTVGTYLGPAVALTTWNDRESGHETWQAYGEKLARKWGKRFAKLPEAKHDADAYAGRVLEGIAWGVANERERLGRRSKQAEAEALERTKELQSRLLMKLAKNAGSLTVLAEVGNTLGRYRDVIGRDELIARLQQYSGLSEAQCAESIDDVEQVDVSAWREGLLFQKDEIAATDENLMLILQRYPGLRESFRYNVRASQLEVTEGNTLGLVPGPVEPDSLTMKLTLWFGSLGCRKVSMHAVRHVFAMFQEEIERYDPFLDAFPEALWPADKAREELEKLGKSKLDRWLRKRLGAVGQRAYVDAVGARTLIAAVARAVVPGAQVDTMLVLMGEQGIGKTTAVRQLAGVIPQGYSELVDMRDKDALLGMQNSLLCEQGEMRALSNTQEEFAKLFMTRTFDRVREPYARKPQDHKRRMVFIGTTNDDDFLTDRVNRRYWPVTVTRNTLTEKHVRALWREAALRYAAGECWWLDTPELKALQAEASSHAREENPIETMLKKRLKGQTKVKLYDAIRIVYPDAQDFPRYAKSIARALKSLEFKRKHTAKGKFWVR